MTDRSSLDMASNVIARTTQLLGVPSVVGFEQPLIDVLAAELATLGRAVIRRPGLLAAPGGETTVSAHIDRHGFVTAGGGWLRYAASVDLGRPLTTKLAQAVCERSQLEHVIAYSSTDGSVLAQGTIGHGQFCGADADAAFTATGLSDAPVGTPVAFAGVTRCDEEWFRGQLDNALAVGVALELVASGFDGTVLFTAGEESGRSWRAISDWFDHPTNQLLVLDTSPFVDDAPVVDGAVVLRHADAGASFDAEFTRRVADAARSADRQVVWKDELLAAQGRPLGRTELGRVAQESDGSITGTTLQIPTTDYHTNHESTTVSAIAACCNVLTSFLGLN